MERESRRHPSIAMSAGVLGLVLVTWLTAVRSNLGVWFPAVSTALVVIASAATQSDAIRSSPRRLGAVAGGALTIYIGMLWAVSFVRDDVLWWPLTIAAVVLAGVLVGVDLPLTGL